MIIQLTKEELNKYAKDVAQWYYDCMDFILKNYCPEEVPSEPPVAQLRRLRKKYEDENPRPHWKDLL